MTEKKYRVNPLIKSRQWEGKISNFHQLGGIETAVIDNGWANGCRVAWVDTGSGLRFKVVIDRAMDISNAFYNSHSLSWISHLGESLPNPAAIDGTTWLDSFGGGLLTTCGLTHVGGPESDDYGTRGLHDRISHTPANIESIIQPNPKAGQFEMSITGRMIQTTTFGPHLELKRTISARLGDSYLKINDEVTNLGNLETPHMILYHFNFGWPLIDEGADIQWEGDWEAPDDESKKIFNKNNSFKKCSPPLNQHNGSNEAVAFIDITPDKKGYCKCGVYNNDLKLGANLEFSKNQLPWLTNWQHWGKNEYVMALEPCTNPPIGQANAREKDTLTKLSVGETVNYEIIMSVNDFSN